MIKLSTRLKVLAGGVGSLFGVGLLIGTVGRMSLKKWRVQRRKKELTAKLEQLEAEKTRLEEELRRVEE